MQNFEKLLLQKFNINLDLVCTSAVHVPVYTHMYFFIYINACSYVHIYIYTRHL